MAWREDTLVLCSVAPDPPNLMVSRGGGVGGKWAEITTFMVFYETWLHVDVEGEEGNKDLALRESIHL